MRLEGPDPASLPKETADLLALASDPEGRPLLTIAVLAHHPPFLGPFLGWSAALALNGALPRRDHEILALRTAFRCHSDFEWEEHAGYAATAGLRADEIANTKEPAGSWRGPDRTLIDVADELHDHSTVSPTTWATLSAQYEKPALVEVLYTVGQYTMLSMVANAVVG